VHHLAYLSLLRWRWPDLIFQVIKYICSRQPRLDTVGGLCECQMTCDGIYIFLIFRGDYSTRKRYFLLRAFYGHENILCFRQFMFHVIPRAMILF